MNNNEKWEIGYRCKFCGEVYLLEATPAQWREYYSKNRRHIQDIFPEFTAGQRELLVSGICESCFDKMFGQEDSWDE